MPNWTKVAVSVATQAEIRRIKPTGSIPRAMGYSLPLGERHASASEVLLRLQALPRGVSWRRVEVALMAPRSRPAPAAAPLIRRTFRRCKLRDHDKVLLEFARVVPRLRPTKRDSGFSFPMGKAIAPALRRLRRLPDGAGIRAFLAACAGVTVPRAPNGGW